MRHFMFLDESGEANVTNPDPRFDIFVLCGVLFDEPNYLLFDKAFKELKQKYFGNENVVFHSIKMRKKQNAFKIFQDVELLSSFYKDIGKVFTDQNYTVISCIINKQAYKNKFPEKNIAYEEALTFICERAISCVGATAKQNAIHFCLEKRGNKKDAELKRHYTKFVKYGTEYVSTHKFRTCHPTLFFRNKEQNINGLQFADLIAYPIARMIISPDYPKLTFNLFENKLYHNGYGNYKGYGLKFFP